jgi:serine phosphatase RsbU (regulator of sigma subunit)
MLFCTDGLTDAASRDGEQFGMERLHQLCGEVRFNRPVELLQKLFAAVDSFSAGCEQKDDMAATLFHLAE